ncbi:SPOR domain-containing protein [Pseudomonas sp. HK3]|jgi:septal ring-binding cell division protein DamX/type II secretory pathway predicted ATPase ExeA
MADSNKASPDIILLGEREQQLDMLLHVQEFSAMSVLITGPSDIGKTALLNAAMTQLSVHHQIISINALQTNQLPELIDVISLQLGCAANLLDLDSELKNMAQQQETLHLLVDDAHLIADDVLQLLMEKSTQEHGWRLILCGDESLKDRLNSLQSQFENKLYHLIELSPLTEEESEAFISQLFKRSGVDVVPMSLKDMHQLWLLSKGVPGKLIELIELEQDNQKQRSGRLPLGHIAAVCLIGSALFVSFLYQDKDVNQQIDSDDAIAMLLAEQKARKAVNDNLGIAKSHGLSSEEVAIDVVSDEPETILVPKKERVSSAGSVATESADEQPIAVTTKSLERASIPKRVETLESPVGKIKQESVVQSKQRADSSKHPLLSAPSQSYALQLLGVRNEESAKAFVRRFARQMDGTKLTIYETRYKGEPWFVVVYGPMDNKQQANQQASQLSKTIKGQPWVRPISKIQADIRQIR